MEADAFAPLGRVAKTHGLNGEVSVIMAVDLPVERMAGLEVWFVPPPAVVRTGRITGVRPGPKGPLFAIDTVGDLATAETLRGCTVLARLKDLPEAEDECDFVGMTVLDGERGQIGEITDVIVTGANDVWVVEGPFGEVLIPVIDQVVGEIDEESGTVHVSLLPGLIEGE
jgi:16S rRNA processing protein RimM